MRVLIVMDMQKDFIYGTLRTRESKAIIPEVREKIYEFLENNEQIIFTRETNYDNYLKTLRGKDLPIEHCLYNSEGWEIADEFEKVERKCHIIDKETFGCYQLPLAINALFDDAEDVPNISEIQIVGLYSDVSIISNALILRAGLPETQISVVRNACAGTSPEKQEKAFEIMKGCQIKII